MSGGASSVIADVAAELGLLLPAPEGATAQALGGLLPAAATVGNPLDVTAAAMVDPLILTSVVERMMDGPFDVVLVQLTTNADPVAAEMATALVELHRSARKPLIVSRLGSPSLAPRAMEVYRSAAVPVLTWPEDATRVAWALAAVGEVMVGAAAQQEVASAP
jgi:acyl-CoA synthetase (NDP forming)